MRDATERWKEEFSSLSDPRLQDLDRYQKRSTLRLVRMLLQALFREDFWPPGSFHQESGMLTWERDGELIAVRGEIKGAGDRLFLTELLTPLSLSEVLETARRICSLEQNQSWDDLLDELSQGEVVQSVAYAIADARNPPATTMDFEGWTPEGHNLHPGAKTRLGFSAADHMAFSPELVRYVELPWIAVDRSLLLTSGSIDSIFALDENSWALPIHPWQKANVLPHLYGREMERGLIRDLSREPVRCRPCTSLRTLVPEDPNLPILKTAVGSLMTSTERSMSRYTVLQGPVYSEYFRRIFQQRPDFRERVDLFQESGGFCWFSDDQPARSRNLSLLFRCRPPHSERGVAIPASYLTQPTQEGRTGLAQVLSATENPREAFQKYLQLVTDFHLQLYLHYGLALEAHLQNCLTVWSAQGPETLQVRDWGGLRVDGKKMKRIAFDLHAQLDPESLTLTTAEKAEKKLISCLFSNHLTEVITEFARSFSVDEYELWSFLAHITKRQFRDFPGHALAKKILDQDWPLKCLLKMRLGIEGSGDIYQARKNPLREHLGKNRICL